LLDGGGVVYGGEVSPASEIQIVVSRELLRNFRSVKGVILAVLSLLGGVSITLLIAKLDEIRQRDFSAIAAEQLREARVEGLTKAYGSADIAQALATAPLVLLMLLQLTVMLTPLLVALMGFDAVAPDIQHRSVRYWALRSRRWSYIVGKWMGLWVTVSAVTLTLDALVWIVCVARGDATVAAAVGWGLKLWLVTLPMSAAWCAIATLVSSLFRRPVLALLLTFAAFFTLWVVYLIGLASDASHASALVYVYPNHYDRFLLHPHVDKLLTGLGACLGMAAAYVGAGSFFFSRRDL